MAKESPINLGEDEPMDKMLLGLLLGTGIGSTSSILSHRSLLPGVGATLVGLCAGALIDVLADELI